MSQILTFKLVNSRILTRKFETCAVFAKNKKYDQNFIKSRFKIQSPQRVYIQVFKLEQTRTFFFRFFLSPPSPLLILFPSLTVDDEWAHFRPPSRATRSPQPTPAPIDAKPAWKTHEITAEISIQTRKSRISKGVRCRVVTLEANPAQPRLREAPPGPSHRRLKLPARGSWRAKQTLHARPPRRDLGVFFAQSASFTPPSGQAKLWCTLYRRVVCRFSNGLGYQMPYGPLIEFRKTGTHSRVRNGCHMSTFLGRGRDNLWFSDF